MTTLRYYVKQTHTSLSSALPDIVRFLINDHPTITGPGWTIVEAQSGANREVPSDSSNLDSLVSATDWPNGSISVGDWIVLESADALNTNHFQLYIEYQATSQINFMVIPFEDFSTGGGAASPPTFPSTAFGEGASLFTMSVYTTTAGYTVIADEGMMHFLVDELQDQLSWTFIGELIADPLRDSRPYVLRDVEATVAHSNQGYNRLSPFDNTTILVSGVPTLFGNASSGNPLHEEGQGKSSGFKNDFVLPVGILFSDSGHQHFAGYMRDTYSVFDLLGFIGITPDRRFFYFNSTTSSPGVAVKWDGTSEY